MRICRVCCDVRLRKFGKLVADETEKWAKVVKFADISVE
jgi:hypothetical protein